MQLQCDVLHVTFQRNATVYPGVSVFRRSRSPPTDTRACRGGSTSIGETRGMQIPVLDLELSRVVGQRVQGLEHQDLEHQDWVIGWAATPRSIRASERGQQRAPENLELDQLSHPDQWVA